MSSETMGAVIKAAEAHAEDETATALARQQEQHAADLAAANARATQAEQSLAALRAEYDAHMATHQPPPLDPEPEPEPVGTQHWGISVMPEDFDARMDLLGRRGLTVRRLFGDLVSNGRSKASLIEDAHRDGMDVVVSYKMADRNFRSGSEAAARATADYLNSLGRRIHVALWHEPYDDMTGPEFIAMQERLLPLMKRPNLVLGPILHGWLLDNQVAKFETYISDRLLTDGTYGYFGIDTYQPGTEAAPKPITPGSRIPKLQAVLRKHGKPDMPIVIGEWNAWTASAIRESAETILSTPQVEIACFWDNTGGVGKRLEGERLAAFKAALADPRVAK